MKRKNDLEQLKRRIIDPEEPQNTAIFGLPRIGKSSLVYKAVLDNKDILISKKTIPIRIDLSDLKKGRIFLKK
jgi:AAA+ ATPase superfamily predicted ATPase